MSIVPSKFFQRSTPAIAKDMLGMFLVRKIGRKTIAGMITEVEVYDGFQDRASHASRGKTPRNTPMFERGGIWYVYFTYGMHWMLNIVTREKGYPAAILIRAIHVPGVPYAKTNGPAKLTKFLRINKHFNGFGANKSVGLWIEDRGARSQKIQKGPRIGVGYAGSAWSRKALRFYIRP